MNRVINMSDAKVTIDIDLVKDKKLSVRADDTYDEAKADLTEYLKRFDAKFLHWLSSSHLEEVPGIAVVEVPAVRADEMTEAMEQERPDFINILPIPGHPLAIGCKGERTIIFEDMGEIGGTTVEDDPQPHFSF